MSLYHFIQRNYKTPLFPQDQWPFEKWVKGLLLDDMMELVRGIHWNARPTVSWLSWQGEIVVDYVGKFETLQDSWEEICGHLGIEFDPLPHVNKTDHEPYTTIYRKHPELVDIVGDYYRHDIEKWGYDLGG